MDHEFGTSALSKGVVGWDWFGLQLDDGTALMFGRLRKSEGGEIGIFEGTVFVRRRATDSDPTGGLHGDGNGELEKSGDRN